MLSVREKVAMVRNCEMLYGYCLYGSPLWQRNMNVDAHPDVVVVEGPGQAYAASENWLYAGCTRCCWKNAKPWQRCTGIIGINAFEAFSLLIASPPSRQFCSEAVASCLQA